jgi:aminoglycoside phosphotransferase (APT) family kinase protein
VKTATVNTVTVETEEISAALLAALERDTGGGGYAYAAEPSPLGGGFWADLFTFRLERGPAELAGELVAKITPTRSHGEREALVQAAVVAQGYPAPPVLAGGAGPRAADSWYFVMPCAEGAPPLSAVQAGALVRAVPSLARRLPGLLADLAVRLHQLDPAPLRDALTSRPGWPVDVDDLVADIATAADRMDDVEHAAAIRTMLAARPQPEPRDVVCHGDFHPLNLIVGPAGATVIDWTAARLGPPAFDVAFTALVLAHPPIEVGRALRGPLHLAGRWLAHRFVAGYRRRARAAGWDLPAEEFAWYTGVHAARILIDAGQHGDAADGHPYAMLTGPASEFLTNGRAGTD